MTRLRLGLNLVRDHKFNHNFKTVLIFFVFVVWIYNQLLTFSSTGPYLMKKESLL